MIDAVMINEIIDPQDKMLCDGYVIVSNVYGNYLFEPYLSCEPNFVSDNYGEIDMEAPVLTLLGDNPTMISQGSVYVDSGATALDNWNGDVSSRIIVTGTVNTNNIGTYFVVYNVIDNAGNLASATRTVSVVTSDYSIAKGVNKPALASGMTPIKWDGGTLIETTEDDPDWYDYTEGDKKWANAQTADGSMWVWIPRYIYRISVGWHTSTAGTIDVMFTRGIDDTIGGTVSIVNTGMATDSNGTWTNQPAFTFGEDELTGIWVGKFDASGPSQIFSESSYPARSHPSARASEYIQTNVAFNHCRIMETNDLYGWGTTGEGIDTHLMKNVEWGAIAYLSRSTYGKYTEVIWRNNSENSVTGVTTTGCAGDSPNPSVYAGCPNAYNTPNGMQASTTGTVYGIYDTAGGVSERIAGRLISGTINPDKYWDQYIGQTLPAGHLINYNNTINRKGDAIYETSALLSDTVAYTWNTFSWSAFPYEWDNLVVRGGGSSIWDFGGGRDNANYSNNGFRPVLVVGEGL